MIGLDSLFFLTFIHSYLDGKGAGIVFLWGFFL